MTSRKPWLAELRNRLIVDPISSDPRSSPGMRLGHDASWIFNHAIGGGQADFDQPIDDLSPEDRVRLYALFNQKAHVDELIHAFEKFLPDPARLRGTTVVDIGCGPFTAGLALANVVGDQAAYRYYGVDRAAAMRAFAVTLAQAVRDLGQLTARTEFSFHGSVDEIDFGRRRGAEITLFILSYLLASATIDVNALVDEIERARHRIGMGPALALYTNTATQSCCANYPAFRHRMVAAGYRVNVEEQECFQDSDKPRDIHYALFERSAIAVLSASEFAR